MLNTILAKRVNHIVAKGDHPVWPKGSKSHGFSTDMPARKYNDTQPVYFIFLPAKVVPCPTYPDKVRPLWGWLKENHPRYAPVFFPAKPCTIPDTNNPASKKSKYWLHGAGYV